MVIMMNFIKANQNHVWENSNKKMLNILKNKKFLILKAGILLTIFIGGILSNQLYSESKSKEFLGCENYIFDSNIEKLDSKIFDLMKEKKYEEAINLGNKHLKDDGIWYCDNYFWNERAEAFYNLDNCYQTLTASLHAIFVTPREANKSAKEFYDFVGNSDICIVKD